MLNEYLIDLNASFYSSSLSVLSWTCKCEREEQANLWYITYQVCICVYECVQYKMNKNLVKINYVKCIKKRYFAYLPVFVIIISVPRR